MCREVDTQQQLPSDLSMLCKLRFVIHYLRQTGPLRRSMQHTANHSATNPSPLPSAIRAPPSDTCRYVIRLDAGKWTGTAAGYDRVGVGLYTATAAHQPRVSKTPGGILRSWAPVQ